MKINRIRTLIIICFAIIFSVSKLNAQVFAGFTAFKELIEYEGQRYLMNDIYHIASDGSDRLKIN